MLTDVADAPGRESRRQVYAKRLSALEQEAASFVSHWREIALQILPRARFQVISDTAQGGDKKHRAIVNNAAGLSLRTAVAGMVSGLTSPSRPWRRLGLPDPDAQESAAARATLHTMESRLELATSKSNAYQILAALYADLLAFGTGCVFCDEDQDDLFRFYHQAIGTYYLACGPRGVPDTLYRLLAYTVAQLVEKFGLAKCSQRVQNMWKSGRKDDRVEVVHVIEENETYSADRPLDPQAAFAWRSCWFERTSGKGDDTTADGLLHEGGYHERPFFAVRWSVLADDTYGTGCPGMEALGDVKALQAYEAAQALVVEHLADPALAVPQGLSDERMVPGGRFHVPPSQAQFEVKPIYTPNANAIPAIGESKAEIVGRIRMTMMAALWQLLSDATQGGGRKTAEEIRALVAEQLIQLAPLLTRLNDELLDPMTERQLGIMLRAGAFSDLEWPEDLQGQEIRVTYVSMLHTAQQAVALGGLRELAQFVAALAQAGRPDGLEKLNVDKMIDEAARVLGTKPDMLVDEEQLQKDRAARAQAQAEAKAAEAAKTVTGGIKDLAAAPLSPDNVLGRVLGANPQAVA